MRRNFWYRGGQKWLAYSYLDPRFTGRASASPGGRAGYVTNPKKKTLPEETQVDATSPIVVYLGIALIALLSIKLVFGR